MICQSCEIDKDENLFPERKDRSGRRRPYCKECSNNIARARYESHKRVSPFLLKCSRAKTRSKHLKVPFDLTPEYLESLWTGFCPITNQPMELYGDRTDEKIAELDRFIPNKGYVKGNVSFISRKMNRIKNNVDLEELRKLCSWMENFNGND